MPRAGLAALAVVLLSGCAGADIVRMGVANKVTAAACAALVGCAPSAPHVVRVPCVETVPVVDCPAWRYAEGREQVYQERLREKENEDAHKQCADGLTIYRRALERCAQATGEGE